MISYGEGYLLGEH